MLPRQWVLMHQLPCSENHYVYCAITGRWD